MCSLNWSYRTWYTYYCHTIYLCFQRIGYLAAAQSFHEGTDVLMLTTNLIRKDLGSQNMYDAGVAINGLSCFLTPDLARDLANDIMTLVGGSALLPGGHYWHCYYGTMFFNSLAPGCDFKNVIFNLASDFLRVMPSDGCQRNLLMISRHWFR